MLTEFSSGDVVSSAWLNAVHNVSLSVVHFGATGDGVTDDTTALQAALDAAVPVFMPPGIYIVSNTLVFSHGSKLFGYGNYSGVASTHSGDGVAQIKYMGASGATSCVIRISNEAVGVDPDSDSSNRDMQNIGLTNVYINGNALAAFGVYMVRAWSNNELSNITVTGTTSHAFWAAKCWNGSPKNWMAYKNRGAGITLGKDTFSWGTSCTVDQSVCTSFFGYYSGYDGAAYLNDFDETTDTEKEYGIGVFGSRALVLLNAQANNCGGAGLYVSTQLSGVQFIGGYSEINGRSSNSTAPWNIWIQGYAGGLSQNITFDNTYMGGSGGTAPFIRLAGTAPSRDECGVVFNRLKNINTINASWDNYRLIDCDQNVIITGSSPGSATTIRGGLQFTAGTADVLDTYVVGSVSPTLGGTTGDGAGWAYSASNNLIAYTKIGRLVSFTGKITLTTKGAGTTGTIIIKGLPYTCSTGQGYNSPVAISSVANMTTNINAMSGFVEPNTTRIQLNIRTTAAPQTETGMGIGDLSNTTTFNVSGSYIASS